MRLGEENDMNRKDGSRKYGNMGMSYRRLSEASGCTEYKIMTYVRLLEPIVEKMD
jgi:hypothetical protein